MLFDIFASILIVICLVSVNFSLLNTRIDTQETIVGIIAFQTELKSKAEQRNHHIIIHNHHLNHKYKVPFNDCYLEFTKSGTASFAGTCSGEKNNITLRPGEGGIGYPWR